jgi:hypothetical protein
MLETDLSMDEEGMTVPYPSLFDGIRKNHGFVDLRGRPELALRIAEGLEGSALRKLLVELAQPHSKIFSVGCDLGTKFLTDEALPYTAGGYVQVMEVAYADRSPEDYARFAQAVAETLKTASQGHEWRVHFVLTPVAFKVDGSSDMTGSLWIWFHAFADSEEQALSSRETLITELRQTLTNDSHTSLLTESKHHENGAVRLAR